LCSTKSGKSAALILEILNYGRRDFESNRMIGMPPCGSEMAEASMLPSAMPKTNIGDVIIVLDTLPVIP
jgi:hypothetical protein